MKADAAPLSAEEEAELRSRYTSVEPPPCRVCGAELGIASMGGGRLAQYACSSKAASDSVYKRLAKDDPEYEHYYKSKWTAPNHPDSRVLRLLATLDSERSAASGSPTDAALPDERDFVAARLMESAWGTRANLDMSEARTVANYLRSFGIGRAASGSSTDAALRAAARDYVDNFPGLGGDYEPDDPMFMAWSTRFDALARAASGSPEPVLDADRLARAKFNDDNPNDHDLWDVFGEASRESARRWARRIAAEYAALAALPSDRPGSEEREPG